MFDSIYTSTVTPTQFFIMTAAALAAGFVYAWIMSFRVRSTKRFFIVTALLPFVVAAVITFVNGNIGAGVAIGGAFGLIRFRSAQGSADEIAAILVAMGSGIAFGMGYIGYGVVILIALSAVPGRDFPGPVLFEAVRPRFHAGGKAAPDHHSRISGLRPGV